MLSVYDIQIESGDLSTDPRGEGNWQSIATVRRGAKGRKPVDIWFSLRFASSGISGGENESLVAKGIELLQITRD